MQSAFSVSSGINPDETSEGRMKKEKKDGTEPSAQPSFFGFDREAGSDRILCFR